ncbi:hypothetical protein IQ07DRAFT_309328 [Pyrenochaeta sp. DS3sAY3a]|nr:hypothetical protein IQ07DRAFT_309328 [Pyrenochaeta sp. DS3sAY3a]
MTATVAVAPVAAVSPQFRCSQHKWDATWWIADSAARGVRQGEAAARRNDDGGCELPWAVAGVSGRGWWCSASLDDVYRLGVCSRNGPHLPSPSLNRGLPLKIVRSALTNHHQQRHNHHHIPNC